MIPIRVIINIINAMFLLIGVIKSILIRQRIMMREIRALTNSTALDESLVLIGENMDVLDKLEKQLAKQKEEFK